MSCPTCDHTMKLLHEPATDREPRIYQCERCGTTLTKTIVIARDGHGGRSVADIREAVIVPKLVERCRAFEKDDTLPLGAVSGVIGRVWARLGIAESINLPGDRPQ